jgi:hypothetical protein
MANQYLIDAMGNGDRVFFRNPILQNFTSTGMDIGMLKKAAWNIGYFDNKKTGHFEMIKNTMKNYSWETASLKTVNEYGRASVMHLRQNRFVLFYTLKDESAFQLSLIDL